MRSPKNVRAPGLLLMIFILSGFSKLQIELEQMMLQGQYHKKCTFNNLLAIWAVW